MRTYRIKSRTRFAAFVLVIIALVFVTGGLFMGSNTVSGMDVIEYETVEVSYGDTLWDIASTYNYDNKDLRKFINELCQVNDINNNTITPGQIIKIPYTL